MPITLAQVEQAVAHAAVRYDRAGDQHYDVASALIKSMRGSDVDAALHYLARMLEAGEDPRFIARRIVIAASEDVGMADPTALQTAVAALHAVAQIGMPEARIILAQAVVHNALAPKSNAATGHQRGDRRRPGRARAAPVPPHLRGSGYAGADPPRARQGLRLRPRRARRGGRAAVPAGRPRAGRRRTTGPPTAASRSGSGPAGSGSGTLRSAVGNDLSDTRVAGFSWKFRPVSVSVTFHTAVSSWRARIRVTSHASRGQHVGRRVPDAAVPVDAHHQDGERMSLGFDSTGRRWPPRETSRAAGPGGGRTSGTAVRPSQIAWDRLRNDKVAIVCFAIMLFFVLVAIFAPFLLRQARGPDHRAKADSTPGH